MAEPMTCKEVFETLPARFNPQGAGTWKATIQFNLSGPGGGNWFISVENGTCNVSEGKTTSPTATVNTSDKVWLGVTVEKKVDPQMAFMTGQLTVQGNIADVMKMNNPSIFKKM